MRISNLTNTYYTAPTFKRAPREDVQVPWNGKSEVEEYPKAIQDAKDYLGIKNLALILHQSSFPVKDRDLFIGSHINDKALELNKFLKFHGFDSIQLGPPGLTKLSPYQSSINSKNYLYTDLEKFATKEQITEEVIYVDEFPSAGIKDTIYVNSNGQSKIWNGDSFISMSIEIAENINTPNQTTVPTTQAVKDYVDANAGSGGISSITVGSGLTGNGTSESPLSIDLSHFDTAYGIEIVADETLKLVSNHSIVIGDNNVGVTINAPVLTLNDHDLNTAGGLAQVEENTGKLPASIIPNVGSSAPTYTKVTINQSDFSNDDASYTLNGETGGKYYELNGICDVTVTNADGSVAFESNELLDGTKVTVNNEQPASEEPSVNDDKKDEDVKDEEENPKTSDGIVLVIGALTVSILVALVAKKKLA